MVTYSHLHPRVQAQVALPTPERIAALRCDRYVEHRRLRAVIDECEYLISSPPRTRTAGLAVVAPSGSGKTMLSEVIQRRHGPKAADGPTSRRTHRAVGISMTGARDARTLYNRFLDQLGAPVSTSMRYSDRERRLVRVLRDFDARILVVDELQDVLTSTPRQQRLALDAIKYLMNEAQLPLLALGTDKVAKVLNVDPHLATRFRVVSLPVWAVDDELEAFLKALEPLIALKRPSRLCSPTIMSALVDASKGKILGICELIEFAAIFAVLDGKEAIDVALIQRASKEVPAGAVRRMQEGKA